MRTTCNVCFHMCELLPGQTGFCNGRQNIDGKIIPLNYSKITALALDPIEKKPLRNFHPGSLILSVGSYGCNLRCPFCQNFEISMASKADIETQEITPEELCNLALMKRESGNIGVAYTYNEPLIGYEFVRDTAKLVKEAGMVNVLVTNGTASPQVLSEISPYIDAMNIDLKGFTDDFYKKVKGDLETVKRFITEAHQSAHIEVTTLVIPGMNDSEEEIGALAKWLASLDADIPLHLSRFFPRYQMLDNEATEIAKIYRLAGIARRYLKYVYMGNC
ncbi:AmmeMemoRadiSam system radical SAM enzyme [Ohessyouella blattaphilus]|uniref:AmmeMemoRadiSam system radical SAM enzyme n=1 Tax=Ohessyouella blattaphilus TaxID=2949333 RepID=A0ABT1EHK9_9FIRM|nr:AmmeMemoRadiSam system radical SAM enzyme [Ohessyouella blattaphilus]MCP1110190.1 AmmeMemoRadiSam system radical SAM enzyme [Ohessyouella blattaphilus]MCR8563584.1 AmmeMemoRadiSam system radical SAM enzyme [Ohessyouella blattaphilus]